MLLLSCEVALGHLAAGLVMGSAVGAVKQAAGTSPLSLDHDAVLRDAYEQPRRRSRGSGHTGVLAARFALQTAGVYRGILSWTLLAWRFHGATEAA